MKSTKTDADFLRSTVDLLKKEVSSLKDKVSKLEKENTKLRLDKSSCDRDNRKASEIVRSFDTIRYEVRSILGIEDCSHTEPDYV
jgi:FtsZ-binding cell division protein ZapB